ncbi:dimethylaniline monooxygenase [N-oxide-forming] 1-like, partial [Pecten maximus]|uniref:dimethylaniline monooxygenase [N-oxide-forming] 1-like n=1 Tax=Pecten maximus TaxID=6579 RepID=UPI001458D42F
MAGNQRVCVIGAGPGGMSFLYQNNKLKAAGKGCVDVVCYEKQSNWGGLWNFTWRTGVDEYGEFCHGGQYRDLWSNGPKECLEYPDYTFEDHFGKVIPSFPPRTVLFDYLQGT